MLALALIWFHGVQSGVVRSVLCQNNVTFV
jgi:hypothetical protein